MSKHGKVLVAMSGGIDSSVTAMMLHEQGYEVLGITMKTWDYESSGSNKRETGCCSLDSINDARSMAVSFGFPHYILDIRGEFGEFIINNFVEEYLAGRTPNPCVLSIALAPPPPLQAPAAPYLPLFCLSTLMDLYPRHLPL